MASIGQLTAALSACLGIEEATVAVFTRNLRDAGLIRKGGRGPSAARMLPIDAARALLGFLYVDRSSPRDVAEAVKDMADLQFVGVVDEASENQIPHQAEMHLILGLGLSKSHSFEQAVAAIIEAFTSDEMNTKERAATQFGNLPIPMANPVGIKFDDNFLSAEILFWGILYTYRCTGPHLLFSPKWKPRGIKTTRRIDRDVIVFISDCLAGREAGEVL
jgi:hypothetical protein